MSRDNQNETQSNQPSLWSAVVEVIKGLRKQPVLLFGFGLAILLMAVAALAVENLRIIAVSLIVIFIVALVVLLILQAMRLRPPQQFGKKIRGGRAVIGKGATVDQADVVGGSERLSELPSGEEEISAGDAVVGRGAIVKKSKVKGGDVKIGK